MISIGILSYPGVQVSAVLGLADLFALASRTAEQRGLGDERLEVIHARADHPETFAKQFEGDPTEAGRCAVLILPPSLGEPISAAAAAPLVPWLRNRHAEGTVLASVCGGAFLLGETGLLVGRTVTTHWIYAEQFRSRFSNASVDTDRLIIDGGDIISAGGLMSWIDLGLKIVDRFLGPIVMAQTARIMLVDPPGREQCYYSGFVPRLTHGDTSILKVQHLLQAREGKPVRLSALAEQAGLEERTFLRRFQKATGLTPTEYAQRLRISKAQELLQFGQQSIERIAWTTGYSDPGAFRKIFIRLVGLTPGEYRQRFQAG